MPIRALLWQTLLCLSLLSGCLARQVAEDGSGIRQALVEMYSDQALDNLARAYDNRLFVQLKYSMLTVKDTDDATATAAGGEADFLTGRAKDLTKTGAAQLTNARSFTGKFPFGGSGQRDRVMTFHADPVTDQNFIYDEYLKFARDPALFRVSDVKPCEPTHVCKKCGRKWYWVPTEAGAAFLELVIKTSFLPPPSAPAEGYYDSAITAVEHQLENGTPVPFHYILILSKGIPNDEGVMQVILKDGRKAWLPIYQLDPKMKDGDLTNKVLTQYNEKTLRPDIQAMLRGSSIRFYSNRFPNPNPKGTSDNQKVLDALETIRLQLLRGNPNLP
jgi:hypothetical protein